MNSSLAIKSPNRIAAWFRFSALYWLIFASGAAWMLIYALQSPDAYFHDEIGHFLISRYAWREPSLILDIWGRPFNTLVYMIPALGDLFTARLFAIAMSAATVLVTTRIAKNFGIRSLALIPLTLWFQPWFITISYAANTMIPFSLLLTLGVYCWQTGRLSMASLLLGLLPLTRHEGIALTGIWTLYMAWGRHWRPAVIAVAPMAVYNLLYLVTFGTLASGNLFNFQPTTFYGSGSWTHYFPYVIVQVSPVLLLLALPALPAAVRQPFRHRIFLPYVLYLSVHVVIYRFGLFASGGYGFFLLPLAPAFALAATAGVETLTQAIDQSRLTSPKLVRVVLVLVVAVGVISNALRQPTRPYTTRTTAHLQAAGWLEDNGFKERPTLAMNVWFYYFYDLEIRHEYLWVHLPVTPSEAEVGTVAVWDGQYSDRWGLRLDELTSSPEWRLLAEFGEGYMQVFEKYRD